MASGYRHATIPETVAINELLKNALDVIHPIGSAEAPDGYVKFKDGNNDQTVVNAHNASLPAASSPLSKASVAKIRSEMFGITFKARKPGDTRTVVSEEASQHQGIILDQLHAAETNYKELYNRITLLERFANRIGTNAWQSILKEAGRL